MKCVGAEFQRKQHAVHQLLQLEDLREISIELFAAEQRRKAYETDSALLQIEKGRQHRLPKAARVLQPFATGCLAVGIRVQQRLISRQGFDPSNGRAGIELLDGLDVGKGVQHQHRVLLPNFRRMFVASPSGDLMVLNNQGGRNQVPQLLFGSRGQLFHVPAGFPCLERQEQDGTKRRHQKNRDGQWQRLAQGLLVDSTDEELLTPLARNARHRR